MGEKPRNLDNSEYGNPEAIEYSKVLKDGIYYSVLEINDDVDFDAILNEYHFHTVSLDTSDKEKCRHHLVNVVFKSLVQSSWLAESVDKNLPRYIDGLPNEELRDLYQEGESVSNAVHRFNYILHSDDQEAAYNMERVVRSVIYDGYFMNESLPLWIPDISRTNFGVKKFDDEIWAFLDKEQQ